MDDPRQDHAGETESLVRRALDGDEDAATALYRLYENRMIAVVHRRLGDTLHGLMESVDLVQSTWKDVLGDMADFEYRGPESFPRWLNACLINKIRAKGRHFGAGKRDVKRLQDLRCEGTESGFSTPIAASDPTPSRVAIGREQLEQFRQILTGFPDAQREVLLLRMRDGLSYSEMAERMDRSVDAVKKVYGRALKRLVGLVKVWKGDAQ